VVLFVDDEESVLGGIRDALRREPFDILTARSSSEGLAALAANKVDVVVSDEQMPGMSGSEFLALVREKYPRTIRLILSGQATLESAVRAINEGEIYRFLLKPCNSVQLGHTIRDALLVRDLTQESARLLATVRRQRATLANLEAQYAGISHVEREADGAIVIETDDVDAETVLEELRGELARGGPLRP
jgi:DNA-binding NtrC family response regulator